MKYYYISLYTKKLKSIDVQRQEFSLGHYKLDYEGRGRNQVVGEDKDGTFYLAKPHEDPIEGGWVHYQLSNTPEEAIITHLEKICN